MNAKLLPLFGLLALSPGVLPAQTADPEAPPPVLALGREEIKPGKMGVHGKTSAGYAAVLAKANPAMHWIGFTPVSGDDNVTMYLSGHPSFAQAISDNEKADSAIAQNASLKAEVDRLGAASADVHASQRTSYYVYRAANSYHAPKMSDMAKARYLAVTTFRIKPGRVPDWNDYAKTLNAAREKAGANWLANYAYQSAIGVPAGTFLSFRPLRSLSELDDDNVKSEERQKAIDAALGGEMVVKMRRDLIAEILVESPTTNVYAVSREDSLPSAQFAAADPDFWSPKPAAATGKALATKKEAPKP